MSGRSEPQLTLAVTDVRAEARDVMLLELSAPDGAALPPFEPGAHLELALPNGLVRHYSLCGETAERERYLIGVGRDAASRGGSDWLHRNAREGLRLPVKGPRNNFRLDPAVPACRFVAGGIGITPIMAMVRRCRADGRPWRLAYAARSRQRMAFYEDLAPDAPDRVRFHFDDEAGRVLAIADALAAPADGEHIYCCGPAPLMDAVRQATADRPPGTVHFEYFTAPEQDAAPEAADASDGAALDTFEVELRRSGKVLRIAPGTSILEAVEAAGIAHPFSCREGLCGTCRTEVLDGTPEHRDYVLSDEERAANDAMMICVGRAKSARLVLDL